MKLSPDLHLETRDYLENTRLLTDLVGSFGSPLHILFPERIDENITSFKNVYKSLEIDGQIYYAAKANKGESVLEHIAKQSVGVDVSSLYELRAALAHGIPGENISTSGPTKDPRCLILAAQQGSTIVIDNQNELEYLAYLLNSIGQIKKVQVMIRINGLLNTNSRFGVPVESIEEVFILLSNFKTLINLKGFAFHLDGYSISERQEAIITLMNIVQKGRDAGFSCNEINIGGGYTVNYFSEQIWLDFVSANNPSLFFKDKQFSSFYPYHSKHPKDQYLTKILADTSESISSALYTEFKKKDIRLSIEPGRSLLDQAGITLMKVKGTKKTSRGDALVEVEGNINHLSEQWFGSDFLPDPILINASVPTNLPISASVSGNTCLEADMITWRKINFTSIPQNGDLLVYVNTAGYQMDSNESEFHRLPIPEKLAVYRSGPHWSWKLDSRYSMFDSLSSKK